MNLRYFLNSALASIVCTLSSCQTNLPDPSEQASDDVKVVVSSLITNGKNVSVRLAYTENFTDKVTEAYSDRSMLLRALMFPDTTRYYADKYLMKKYYDELLLRVGKVELTTGTGEHKIMEFNHETFNFECSHKPVPGEHLELTATVTSREGKPITVKSKTVVPGWKPEAELVEVTKLYRKSEEREDLDLREMCNDSVYQLKILLKDVSPDIHCYRIKVQGVKYQYKGDSMIITGLGSSFNSPPFIDYMPDDYISWTEAFFTNDPLLYDASLTKSFGAWQAYTSDLFTNKQFKNGSYLLTVQSRYPYTSRGDFNKRRFIQVQLEPISPDLMNYLSSLYRIRIAETGYFSEPQSLASNINGGVGICGSIGEPIILRYWFPGEEDPNYPGVDGQKK